MEISLRRMNDGRRQQDGWQANPPAIKSESRKDQESLDNWDSLILCCQEKLLNVETRASVPQTDTGRQGEKPQVREINHVKELGKMAP